MFAGLRHLLGWVVSVFRSLDSTCRKLNRFLNQPQR
jgi:hypothetical protein